MVLRVVQLFKNIQSRQNAVLNAIRSVTGDGVKIYRNPDLNWIPEMFSKKVKLFKVIDKETKLTTKYVGCNFNKMRELETIFVFDRAEKNIDVFNKAGEQINQYSAREAKALMLYRMDSRSIHKFLREGKKEKIGKHSKIYEDPEICAKTISDIYKNGKASVAKKDIVAYRASDKISLKNILLLNEGDSYEVPSFMSVATSRKKIIPFMKLRNFLHPIEITIPAETKYISLDEIHNIIVPNHHETELLLNKGGKLLITKKPRFGTIKTIYRESVD